MKLEKVMFSVASVCHYKGAVGSPNGHHLNLFKLVHVVTSLSPFTLQGSPDHLIIQRPPPEQARKRVVGLRLKGLLVLNIYLIIPL